MHRALLAVLVLLASALAGCGAEDDPDGDGDGLTDAEERQGWTITVDHVDRRELRDVTSDPRKDDTDGDGIPDAFERALGLDPRDADTDGDGLSDCQEARHSDRAKCEDPAWEGDTDGGLPTEANRADSDPGTSRYVRDVQGFDDPTGQLPDGVPQHGDGLSDGMEIEGFEITLPDGTKKEVRTDPMRKDTDGDLLEDAMEVRLFGTDPTGPDTDGDGCIDGRDTLPAAQEMFRFVLERLDWNASGQVLLDVRVADVALERMSFEEATSDRHETEAVRPGHCGFLALDPWVPVDVVAMWRQDGETRAVAFDEGPRTWWHVREGTYRTGPGADAVAGPLTWSSGDVEIGFSLLLEQAPAQVV